MSDEDFTRGLRARASDGGPPAGLRGLWVTMLSPFGIEALLPAATDSGLDWIGLDLQHGDLRVADVAALLRVSGPAGLPTLVRLPSADPTALARVLDDGPAGIIVPSIESHAQAAAVVAAAYHPPHGMRSTGLSRSGLGLRPAPTPQPLVLVMVETRAGLDARREIAATAGVDGVFVGPYDLTMSLGRERTTDPVVTEAITNVLSDTRAAGRITGYFAGDADLVTALPDVDLLAVDSDVSALWQGVRRLF